MLAYSYVRFSSPEQAKGDSFRRQAEAAASWCQRHGVTLDTATTFSDLGRSAFTGSHRENPDRNALALFLRMVESGRIPRGSCLIIENLDRLTREHIQPALLLVLNLLQAGIKIVQLSPSEMTFDDKSDTLPVMMMMMELSRGHGESRMKAERLGKAWAEKKRQAREAKKPMTAGLPAWLRLVGEKIEVIPEHAATVRRIFDETIAGYGLRSIVARLHRERVPTFGDAPHWSTSYVSRILRERRAMGEFQPMRRLSPTKYKLDGDPIPNYFPAVVTEEIWLAARDAARRRRKARGRKGSHINVFAGLLKDAVNGGTYQCGTAKTSHGQRYRVIFSHAGKEGIAKRVSFPFVPFHDMLLHSLHEIKPRDIADPTASDPSIALASEHETILARIQKIEEELFEGGDDPSLARVLRRLNARAAELAGKLAEARAASREPAAEAWAMARPLVKTVLDMLKSEKDDPDIRIRLQAALRRSIAGIWLAVVPVEGSKDRLCAVQVRFNNSDASRTYVMWHRSASSNGTESGTKPADWRAVSAEEVGVQGIDLRNADDATIVVDRWKDHGSHIVALIRSYRTPRRGR